MSSDGREAFALLPATSEEWCQVDRHTDFGGKPSALSVQRQRIYYAQFLLIKL